MACRRLFPDSSRELQTGETSCRGREPLKLHRDFRRDEDISKQLLKQTSLPDAAEIDEDRSICDDDHLENESLSDWMSDVSICWV